MIELVVGSAVQSLFVDEAGKRGEMQVWVVLQGMPDTSDVQ